MKTERPWTVEEYNALQGAKAKRRSVQRYPNQSPQGWEVFDETGEFAGCVLLFQLPYSKNVEYKNHIHRFAVKQAWENHTVLCWLAANRPVVSNPQVQFRFYFPDNVRRDLDNYTGTHAVKGIWDGMKHRLIRDDCWQQVVTLAPTAEVCQNLPRLEVWVTEREETK